MQKAMHPTTQHMGEESKFERHKKGVTQNRKNSDLIIT